MEVREKLYEGKAKIVYRGEEADQVVIHFKDEATAFNGQKKGIIEEKGALNLSISAALFSYLDDQGVRTHLLQVLGPREMLARKLKMLPLEVVPRNVAAGSISKRLGIPEGTPLTPPVLEFYLKDDDLGDPMLNRYHIRTLGLATDEQVEEIERLAWRVNELLSARLLEVGIRLIDFKLEFGADEAGRIYVADEISPDTCRFWDAGTGEKLDKDRFRRDLGNVEGAYQEVQRRLGVS